MRHINDTLSIFQASVGDPLSEVDLFEREFKQERAAFTTDIAQLKEEKSCLEMNKYLREGEVNRVVKEKNRYKEDLKSLERDYVALYKAKKSQCICKSSTEWQIELDALDKELKQWKTEAKANREKLTRTGTLISTYQRKNGRLESQMSGLRVNVVKGETSNLPLTRDVRTIVSTTIGS